LAATVNELIQKELTSINSELGTTGIKPIKVPEKVSIN